MARDGQSLAWGAFALIGVVHAASTVELAPLVAAEQAKVVAWRRDIHQHPELSNREVRTSKLVAAHLKSLGLDVETYANTGVVGLLKGGQPGPTVALRADMDALPVTEQTQVPFMSHATVAYRGETVGVMHACGHDAHTAMLLGVADILVKVRGDLKGNVLFLFQPAEEGAPAGEEGGAALMLKQGVFDKYHPQAAFGLHVVSGAAGGSNRLPPGTGHGRRGFIQDRRSRPANPWRPTLGGRRSHRRRGANRHRPADRRQPPNRHHRASRHRERGAHPRAAFATTSCPKASRWSVPSAPSISGSAMPSWRVSSAWWRTPPLPAVRRQPSNCRPAAIPCW